MRYLFGGNVARASNLAVRQRGRVYTTREMFRFFIFAYLALLPVQMQVAPKFRLAPSDIVLALALLFLGYRLSAPKHLVGIWHGLLVLMFVVASAATIVRLGEVSTWALVNKTVGFFALLAAYLLIGNYATSMERILDVVHMMVGAVAVYNAVAVAAFIFGFETSILNSSNDPERLTGGLLDPNAYGGLLVVCLIMYAAFRASEARRFSRAMDLFVVVSLMSGILLTLSRSAWMALAFAVAGMIIFQRDVRLAAAGGVLAAMAAFWALALASADDRVLELTVRSGTISGRMFLNQAALNEISLNPLGMGIGGFQDKYGAIVHNTTLWFGADFGIIGLVVFIGFSFWVLKRLIRAYVLHSGAARSVVVGLALGHVAMLALSLAIEAFYQRHWWVVMALSAAAARPATLATLREREHPT